MCDFICADNCACHTAGCKAYKAPNSCAYWADDRSDTHAGESSRCGSHGKAPKAIHNDFLK